MALDTLHWTWLNHFFIWGSIVFYFLFTFTLYSTTFYEFLPSTFPDVGSATNAFGSGIFWATFFVTMVICLWPVVGYRWFMQKKYPTLADQIRKGVWKEKRSKTSSLVSVNDNKKNNMTLSITLAKFRSFRNAFFRLP